MSMKEICDDLEAEYDVLDNIVTKLDNAGWATETYCDGWTVKEEIAHLAYGDNRAMLCATDPEAFEAHKKEANTGDPKARDAIQALKDMDPQDLMATWRADRGAALDAFLRLDPKHRVPWYGPPMSARSKATARLMETWAHGQDVVDVIDAVRPPTDRLRHVCHIGVITLGWSFTTNQLEVPATPAGVAWNGPSGDLWTWGPEDATDSVTGDAEDFCLVVTQRRHHEDTNLVITGETALKWMSISQAFAGPLDKHPPPGTFPKRGI